MKPMDFGDRIRRLVSRYSPTLTWTQVGPTTHLATAGDIDGRVMRRNGSWWLYAVRNGTAAAKAVYLDPNITTAKRMAETALAEPWLLEWPIDEEATDAAP